MRKNCRARNNSPTAGAPRVQWKIAISFSGTLSMRLVLLLLLCVAGGASPSACALDLATARDDQIDRLRNYVLDAIMPSGLVRDALVLEGTSYHPASPDAAGFNLLALSSLDYLGKLPAAEAQVIKILNAYAGHTPGVNPARSPDGHYIHFMDVTNGGDPPGWDDSYTPIGTALLVAGAQFAKRHFADNLAIGALADELTESVDFNAAIHPSLDGRIYLDMTAAGGGAGGAVRPWNEFMLVESLALRQIGNNDRALAVRDLWLDTANLPTRNHTLTDNLGSYAPAFWVQQMHFFNGDFRHNADFASYFERHRAFDKLYSASVLDEEFRYGLTAGVSPQGYHADRVLDHPNNVFSPEAVAAWGDMEAFLKFYDSQFPTDDPRYRYGLVRESAMQPAWVPNDVGLVDHLFLLFGLVESIAPDFFTDRVFPGLVEGDFDFDGVVDGRDFLAWQRGRSLTSALSPTDLATWQANYDVPRVATGVTSIPEPLTSTLGGLAILLAAMRRHSLTTSR